MFVVLQGTALAAQVAPASQPTTQPTTRSAELEARVDSIATLLLDKDAKLRRVAVVWLRDLDGPAIEYVTRAIERPDLTPDARGTLRDALPLLESRARRSARARETSAIADQLGIEAYQQAGKKDPRWDELVHQALAHTNLTTKQAVEAYTKCIDAGCDDPFLLYLHARAQWLTRSGERDAVIEQHRDAAIAMAATNYPAEWKCRVAARYLDATGDYHPKIARICMDSFRAAVAEARRTNEDVAELAEMVFKGVSRGRDAEEVFELIYQAYVAARPQDPGAHFLRGRRYVEYAWAARGADIAARVTPEGWKLFGEHLAEARTALEKAWKLDPNDARAPTEMLRVCLGGGGPRREMELWFRRAMDADPDNWGACSHKLHYLLPRWHGSHGQMIAFGRECLATRNYWGPLPLILADAHERISKEMEDPKAYLADPEVWRDVEAAYRTFLEAFPGSSKVRWYRSKLAKWACDCQQWDAANSIFAELGGDPDLTVFRTNAIFQYYRRKARSRSTQVRQLRVDPAALQDAAQARVMPDPLSAAASSGKRPPGRQSPAGS